jgi:hypothetical protein
MARESATISSKGSLVGWQANSQQLAREDAVHHAHLTAARTVEAELIGDNPDGEGPGYRSQHHLQARLVERFDRRSDAIEPAGIGKDIRDVAEPDAAQSASRPRRKDVVADLTCGVCTLEFSYLGRVAETNSEQARHSRAGEQGAVQVHGNHAPCKHLDLAGIGKHWLPDGRPRRQAPLAGSNQGGILTMPRWCGFRRRLGDLGDHLVAQTALQPGTWTVLGPPADGRM